MTVKTIKWHGQDVSLDIVTDIFNVFVRATLKKYDETFTASAEHEQIEGKDVYEVECSATDAALNLLAKEIEEISNGRDFFRAAQQRSIAGRVNCLLKQG